MGIFAGSGKLGKKFSGSHRPMSHGIPWYLKSRCVFLFLQLDFADTLWRGTASCTSGVTRFVFLLSESRVSRSYTYRKKEEVYFFHRALESLPRISVVYFRSFSKRTCQQRVSLALSAFQEFPQPEGLHNNFGAIHFQWRANFRVQLLQLLRRTFKTSNFRVKAPATFRQ